MFTPVQQECDNFSTAGGWPRLLPPEVWGGIHRTWRGEGTQLERADSIAAAENGAMPRTMNDPHVDALLFRIEHGPAVRYSDDAPPIKHEEPTFRVTLKDRTVRFELKEHYATKEEARERVGPYVRNWEMDAGLNGRPGNFRLEFQEAEVIDRSPPPPTPGTFNLAATLAAPTPTLRVSLSVVSPSYRPHHHRARHSTRTTPT